MNITQTKQIDSSNLKILKDQIGYEALMNKKFKQYGEYCTDTSLKSLCEQASQTHKQNFNTLKNYLDSHQ